MADFKLTNLHQIRTGGTPDTGGNIWEYNCQCEDAGRQENEIFQKEVAAGGLPALMPSTFFKSTRTPFLPQDRMKIHYSDDIAPELPPEQKVGRYSGEKEYACLLNARYAIDNVMYNVPYFAEMDDRYVFKRFFFPGNANPNMALPKAIDAEPFEAYLYYDGTLHGNLEVHIKDNANKETIGNPAAAMIMQVNDSGRYRMLNGKFIITNGTNLEDLHVTIENIDNDNTGTVALIIVYRKRVRKLRETRIQQLDTYDIHTALAEAGAFINGQEIHITKPTYVKGIYLERTDGTAECPVGVYWTDAAGAAAHQTATFSAGSAKAYVSLEAFNIHLVPSSRLWVQHEAVGEVENNYSRIEFHLEDE